MNQTVFKHHIRALKKRYYGIMSVKALTLFLVFFSFSVMMIAGLKLVTDHGTGGKTVFWVAGMISLAAGSITAYRVTPSFMNTMILADKRLGSRDIFSTAYECLLKDKTGWCAQGLVRQASQTMDSTPHKIILPFRLSRMVFLVFLFSGISLGGYYFPEIHTRPGPELMINPEIKALSRKLETIADQMAGNQTLKEQSSRVHQIQKTARQIQDPGLSRKDVAKSLAGLLDVIETENRKNLEQLQEELALDGDGLEVPSQQPGDSTGQAENGIRIELEDMKDNVDDAFDGKVPEELAEQLEELEKNADFQDFLKDAIDRLEDGFPGNKKSSRDPEGESPGAGEKGAREGDTGIDAGDRKDGMEDGASQRYYAGQKKSGAGGQEPSAIETSDAPIVRDAIGSYDTGALKYTIRALSAPGFSGRTEEEIQRVYQKQNEAVLIKEKIPLEHRELIRDYFLSIGLEKE